MRQALETTKNVFFNCLFPSKKDKEIEESESGDLEVYNGNGFYTYQPGICVQYQLQSYIKSTNESIS